MSFLRTYELDQRGASGISAFAIAEFVRKWENCIVHQRASDDFGFI